MSQIFSHFYFYQFVGFSLSLIIINIIIIDKLYVNIIINIIVI